MIEFRDVVVDGAGGRVLDGFSAAVGGGAVTGLIGPSGAGKTTLLRLCNRLTVPDGGEVLYRGDDVAGMSPLALRRRVGLVFQRPVLIGGTVADNLALARPAPDIDPEATLARVGLDAGFLARQGDTLSGGEAQRVCLARTLLTDPDVLLLDEPTTGLDATPRRRFEESIERLVNDGLTVIWVSHDIGRIAQLAARVIVLIEGTARYVGPPAGLDDAGVAVRDFVTGDARGG